MKKGLVILITIMFFWSCEKDNPSKKNHYLHVSHTRSDSNPHVDNEVKKLDFEQFDMLLLGGDIAYSTSLNNYTMEHIDLVFDVGNESTLWALGNHDYANLNRVEYYTNRPPFYSFHRDGATFIVLDTQDDFSNISGAQKDFFDSVVDTIINSSHVILLHHKLIWMYGNPNLENEIDAISNGGLGDCFWCINPNNFYVDIYPKLVSLTESGIQVFCVGGDLGKKVVEFEHITQEGVYFLASGINFGDTNNKCLVFSHDIINQTIEWNFELITDLVAQDPEEEILLN